MVDAQADVEGQLRLAKAAEVLRTHPTVEEAIPGLGNLTVVTRGADALSGEQSWLLEHFSELSIHTNAEQVTEIPAFYNGADLADIAERVGCSVERVIALHSERVYTVMFMGYRPGFPYLGNVDERIRVPRHTTPRPRVARGSIAIANGLTGIYPSDAPGGWNIVATTDVMLFDAAAASPVLLSAGQQVRFVPQ